MITSLVAFIECQSILGIFGIFSIIIFLLWGLEACTDDDNEAYFVMLFLLSMVVVGIIIGIRISK